MKALIVTRGAQGSQVWVDGACQTIAAAPIREALDPTGCGDAYRGGLLYGLSQEWDWVRAARLGSVMGAIKIEQQGAQNHTISRDDVARRHEQAYAVRRW